MNCFVVTSEGEFDAAGICEGDQPLEFLHGRLFEMPEGVGREG